MESSEANYPSLFKNGAKNRHRQTNFEFQSSHGDPFRANVVPKMCFLQKLRVAYF